MKKKCSMTHLVAAIMLIAVVAVLSGCRESERVSYNIARDADEFKVYRQITVFNGITNGIKYQIEGLISVNIGDGRLDVMAKVNDNEYHKDIFLLGDNDSANIVQIENTTTDPYRYVVILNPEMLLPYNIEIAG